MTKSITLEECPVCDFGCVCPSLNVTTSTKSAKPGMIVSFTAVAEGYKVTYRWEVENGTIVQGADANKIEVLIPPNASPGRITATVVIDGTDPNCNCPTTASESIDIIPPSNSGA